MILPWEKLINLSVQTKSGERLGTLIGFDIDVQTHEIKAYRVKSRGLIKGLLRNELVISREQVISINDERMVVYDAVVGEGALAGRKIAQVAPKNELGITSRIQRSQE